MEKLELQFVRREILTYCQRFPVNLKSHGSVEAGPMAVGLGNCLVWISSRLDNPGPQVERAIDCPADSIYALGRQLQEVGREVWDREHKVSPTLASLQSEVDRLGKLVSLLAAEREAGK